MSRAVDELLAVIDSLDYDEKVQRLVQLSTDQWLEFRRKRRLGDQVLRKSLLARDTPQDVSHVAGKMRALSNLRHAVPSWEAEADIRRRQKMIAEGRYEELVNESLRMQEEC